MSEKKSLLDTNIYIKNITVLFGMMIASIGINAFLSPSGLLSGGTSGVSIILNRVVGLNIGLATFLLNIPVFILAFKYLDKKFCLESMMNTLVFSFVVGLGANIRIPLEDILLQSVFGGVMTGAGYGLIFKSNTSLGGTDIIAAIMKKYFNIEVQITTLSINFVIVLVGGVLFGMELAMYTLISIYVSSTVLGKVKDLMENKASVMLISNKPTEIAQDIMDNLNRGVTYIEAEGAYTNEKKKILYCIVSSAEIGKLKSIALKHDKRAFMSINNVSDVKGKGFRNKVV